MSPSASKPPTVVLTVGHSNRPLETFIALLEAHGVKQVVDVRTLPRSRHNPQFNKESLPEDLLAVGIAYDHMPGLGGLRHPRRDSSNTAWRSAGFRGFADHMETPEFASNLDKLLELARRKRTAVMCAEAVPWRCHRSLIADALLVRGVKVEHILSSKHLQEHSLTPFAKVQGRRVTYPPDTLELEFDPERPVAGRHSLSASH
jgi:uncharacterized protein (DUF488 family)